MRTISAWTRSRSPEPKTPDRTYVVGTWLFLRVVGLAFFFAFLSASTQIDGLLGSNGILPANEYLARVDARLGVAGRWWVPTAFWLSASDAALGWVSVTGAAVALVFTAGILERWLLIVLWGLYFRFAASGRCLAFQWTRCCWKPRSSRCWSPVLEGFAALRSTTAERRGAVRCPSAPRQTALVIGLGEVGQRRSALARRNGDDFHYETQPLPTWVGWLAHQLPAYWHGLEVFGVFAIQIGVAPVALTPWRGWAFVPLVGLQALIALTGNYCFFNLLTVGLCAVLLSDRGWLGRLPSVARRIQAFGADARPRWRAAGAACAVALGLAVAVPLGLTVAPRAVPAPLEAMNDALRPLRTFNAYGLFARMTTTRFEIQIEGSNDGHTWHAYRFHHKPGPLATMPSFVAPFQPRLDWQMWFAASVRPRTVTRSPQAEGVTSAATTVKVSSCSASAARGASSCGEGVAAMMLLIAK